MASTHDETRTARARSTSSRSCVVPAVIAVACLPFLFNERTGVLGEGIYTNDQAAQLYWADWLADGFGPQPNAVSVGYPVGPQALGGERVGGHHGSTSSTPSTASWSRSRP